MLKDFDINVFTSSRDTQEAILSARQEQYNKIANMQTVSTECAKTLNPHEAIKLLQPSGHDLRASKGIASIEEARACIHPFLMNIRMFAQAAIMVDPNMYAYLPEKLKESPTFAMKLLINRPELFDAMPQSLQNNQQVKDAYIDSYLRHVEEQRIEDVVAMWPTTSLCMAIDPREVFSVAMYKAAFEYAMDQATHCAIDLKESLTFKDSSCVTPNEHCAFINLAKAMCPEQAEEYANIEKEVLKEKSYRIWQAVCGHAYNDPCSLALDHLIRTRFAGNQDIIAKLDNIIYDAWERRLKDVCISYKNECRLLDRRTPMGDAEMDRSLRDCWRIDEARRDVEKFEQILGKDYKGLYDLQTALGEVYSYDAMEMVSRY